VVKIMVNMAEAGEVLAKEEEWIDNRCRKRVRSLYRARQAESESCAMDILLMRALGISSPVAVQVNPAHCRKHYMGD
jgi:hypothetical protein